MYAARWRSDARRDGPAIVGVVLVVLGVSFLAGFDWGILWPVILIVLGIGVLRRCRRG